MINSSVPVLTYRLRATKVTDHKTHAENMNTVKFDHFDCWISEL